MYPYALLLHLLGAAVWTGGHLVLSLAVLPRAMRTRDPQVIRDFEAGFERVGIPALLVQVATGLWLAHRYVADPRAWFSLDGHYPPHILAKLALLAVTLGLALHARLGIIPTLSERTLPKLAAHIVAITIVSVLFVVAGVSLRTGGF